MGAGGQWSCGEGCGEREVVRRWRRLLLPPSSRRKLGSGRLAGVASTVRYPSFRWGDGVWFGVAGFDLEWRGDAFETVLPRGCRQIATSPAEAGVQLGDAAN